MTRAGREVGVRIGDPNLDDLEVVGCDRAGGVARTTEKTLVSIG